MYTAARPWSHLPPDDGLLTALTGCSFLQSSYEDVPVWFVAPMVSYHYALSAATAIVATLYERTRTGRGQALVVSGLDALAIAQSGGAIQAEGQVVGTSNHVVPFVGCSLRFWFPADLTQRRQYRRVVLR